MTASKHPPAPAGLGVRGKKLWADLHGCWTFTADESALLRLACEALDRAHEAQELLNTDGVTTHDRFGQVKEHPAVAIRTAAEGSCARLLRQLGLNVEQDRLSKNDAIRLGTVRHYRAKRNA